MSNCTFCPRRCAVNRSGGEAGFCGAQQHTRVARVMAHHWEEPMISGTRGSGAVFFSGCNLRCVFCQNMDISAHSKGSLLDSVRLADLFLALERQGVHNINLVTPTPHLHAIRDALIAAKKRGLGIPVVYNSSGYECIDALQHLEGLIDIYLPDLKYFSSERSFAYCGVSDYFQCACAAIEEMYRQVGNLRMNECGIAQSGLIIRHLVLPGNVAEARAILDFIYSSFPAGTYVSLMRQYTPAGPALAPPLDRKLTAREYARAVDYALAIGLTNILTQEGESSDTKFIPDFFDELSGIC